MTASKIIVWKRLFGKSLTTTSHCSFSTGWHRMTKWLNLMRSINLNRATYDWIKFNTTLDVGYESVPWGNKWSVNSINWYGWFVLYENGKLLTHSKTKLEVFFGTNLSPWYMAVWIGAPYLSLPVRSVYHQVPPITSVCSNTVTLKPCSKAFFAAAKPEMPAPITAISKIGDILFTLFHCSTTKLFLQVSKELENSNETKM